MVSPLCLTGSRQRRKIGPVRTIGIGSKMKYRGPSILFHKEELKKKDEAGK